MCLQKTPSLFYVVHAVTEQSLGSPQQTIEIASSEQFTAVRNSRQTLKKELSLRLSRTSSTNEIKEKPKIAKKPTLKKQPNATLLKKQTTVLE